MKKCSIWITSHIALLILGIFMDIDISLGALPLINDLPPVGIKGHIIYHDGHEMAQSLSPPPPSGLGAQNDEFSAAEATEDDIMGDKYDVPPPTNAAAGSGRRKRKLQGSTWANGIVPYEFSTTQPHNEAFKQKIRQAIKMWEDSTCVKFVENPNAAFKVSFTNDPYACSSFVGYHQASVASGRQIVKLNDRACSSLGTMAHELGHTLGLIHEHSRTDRDDHVNIHIENVAEKSIHNFLPFYDSLIPMGVRYDLHSVMHYSGDANRKSNLGDLQTITAKNPKKNSLMGQRSALSFYDIMAVNKQYCMGNCNIRCINDGYPTFKDGECRCVCPEGLNGNGCQYVNSDTGCGGVITLRGNTPQTITTPNYPRAYSNSKCVWLITAQTGYLVEVMFPRFDIRSSQASSCTHSMEVRDNVLGQRGNLNCGDGAIGPFDTRYDYKNNQMMIIFDSKDTSTPAGTGFTATVQAYRDGCLTSPCQNKGLCVPTGQAAFTCKCEVGYIGTRCEKADTAAARCDFSEGFCMFKNDEFTDQINLRRMIASNKYQELVQAPTNSDAFFIGAPTEYSSVHGDEAKLLSPVFTTTNIRKRCIKFNYIFAGSGTYQNARLSVQKKTLSTGFSQELFTRSSKTDGIWSPVEVDVESFQDFQIIFSVKASQTLEWNSLIAIDNIAIEPHQCNSGACARNPCAADAVCLESGTNGYTCQCPSGKSGATCSDYDTNGFVCEFEREDMCGWTNNHGMFDHYNWKRVARQADAAGVTGPREGAGGGGHYVLADSSTVSGSSNTALLQSPRLGYAGQICVEFSYHMYGGNLGSLALKAKNRNNAKAVARRTLLGSEHKLNDWQTVSTQLLSFADTRLVFEAISGAKHQSDIAIDKVKITRGSCSPTSVVAGGQFTTMPSPRAPVLRPVLPPVAVAVNSPVPTSSTSAGVQRKLGDDDVFASCDFENGICTASFVALSNAKNHKWQLKSGGTASTGTGPESAQGGSGYVYVEGSDAERQEKTVLTTHKIFQSAQMMCVSFYYSMHGRGIGSLVVSLWPENGLERELWSRSGNQGEGWNSAQFQVDTGPDSEFYQILFTSTRGTDWASDVALDTIHISRSACPQPTSLLSSSGLVSNAAAILNSFFSGRFTNNQVNIDWLCGFENGNYCNFQQSRRDTIDWSIREGQTPTKSTGPTQAYRGRKYAYVEATRKRNNDYAILISPEIPANSGIVCVKFAYHMIGAQLNTLRVIQVLRGAGERTLVTENHQKSLNWQLINREIASTSTPYTIEFEVKLEPNPITGRVTDTDIALDDLWVKSGSC